MKGTFEQFDWKLVGEALDMRVDAKGRRGVVTLRVPCGGRRIVIHDNAGEFNTVVIEPDGGRWEPDFSVAYERRGEAIGPITLAYRIACHAQDRQIDYRVDLDAWPADVARAAALRTLADRIEKGGDPPAAPPCGGDELAPISGLWEPSAGRLTFETALRRGLGIDDDAYAAIVAGVWASERPRQFSALGRTIAAAPVVGSRDVVGSRE